MKVSLKSLGLGCVLLFATACGNPAPTSVLQDAEQEIESHAGVLTVYEDGSEAGEIEVITQTIAIKSESRLIEKSIHIDLADPDNPEVYEAAIKVDGEKMTIKEKDDKFSGKGKFTKGDSWAWTKWETSVVNEDDITVESIMELDGDVLKVDQTLLEGGDELLTIKGELKKITNEKFEERLNEL